MALTLTSADLARIGAAQAALLAPLAAPTLQAWGTCVVGALAEVFGAETGLMRLPVPSARVVSWGGGRELGALFDHFVVEPQAAGAPILDPVVERSTQLRLARGVHAFTYARLDHLLGGALDRSEFYHETKSVLPHREMLGLLADLTRDGERVEGAVHLYCRDTPAFGDATDEVLDLLVPAIEAGVGAAVDLGARRVALDAVEAPLLVCDVDGRTVHETAVLAAALAHDAEGAIVRAEAARLAADLGAPGLAPDPRRTVRTARGTYRLRATRLPEGATFGPLPGVLVAVMPPAAPWPEASVLRERFGLTRREAEVALLLARGLANDAVAFELCISPHTARRHTERVMAKLGVMSRSQVAAALLHPAPQEA